ncbi:MAG: stage II sporulation protein M [Candidatus Nitrosotenuis sp.]
MKKRIIFFFIFLAAFSVSFSIGAQSEVPEEESKIFLDEFNKIVNALRGENFGVEIFFHNTQIALPMFIPGFGVGWGIFSAFSTGFAFAALSTTEPLLANIPPITMIFATPFGLMELAAYSIAMSRSFILIVGLIKKLPILKQWPQIAAEVGIVIGLLLAGGIIEAYMIESFAGMEDPTSKIKI